VHVSDHDVLYEFVANAFQRMALKTYVRATFRWSRIFQNPDGALYFLVVFPRVFFNVSLSLLVFVFFQICHRWEIWRFHKSVLESAINLSHSNTIKYNC
jgi:hypothetical protein